MLLEVANDDTKLSGGEHHGGQSREQDRDTIKPFNTQAGSRVGFVGSGKTCIEQSKDCAPVCRESCQDVGSVAVDASDNTHMLCRFRKVDEAAIDTDGGDDLGILNQ